MNSEFDLAIVGNGILGMSTAFAITTTAPDLRVAMIGPPDRSGSDNGGGRDAGMLCRGRESRIVVVPARLMFDMSRRAASMWPQWLQKINDATDGEELKIEYGTYVLQNAAADDFDDSNFEEIRSTLKEYQEPFDDVSPRDIPGFSPEPAMRAINAVYIPGEGAVSPTAIVSRLQRILSLRNNVHFVNSTAKSLQVCADGLKSIGLDTADSISAKRVIVCNGAKTTEFTDTIPELRGKIPKMFFGVGTGVVIESREFTPTKVIRTPNRGLACGVHVVPRGPKHCYVGATNFISPIPEYSPRMTSLFTLLESAMEQVNVNFYKAKVHNVVVGHRPTSADTYPVIGATSVEGLYVLSGTKRIGIHMAPLISTEFAALVLKGQSELPSLFKPERRLIHTMTRTAGVEKAVSHLRSAAYQHGLSLPKAGWNSNIEDMLRHKVESVYEQCGITEFGIHPELLDMYRYGHISPDA